MADSNRETVSSLAQRTVNAALNQTPTKDKGELLELIITQAIAYLKDEHELTVKTHSTSQARSERLIKIITKF